MAPAEDTTGNWDTFLLPNLLDDLHSASPLFLGSHSATSVTTSTSDLTMTDLPSNRRVAKDLHEYTTASGHASVLLTPKRIPRRHTISKVHITKPSAKHPYHIASLGALSISDHIRTVNTKRDLAGGEKCGHVVINSPLVNEDTPLSPLSICSPWNNSNLSPLGCLSDDLFGNGIFEGDTTEHHDKDDSPEETNTLFGPFEWASPASTDTDLDESPSMLSSVSSLSPEDQFRHSSLDDSEEEDDQYSISSPPMYPHDPHSNSNPIYHPLDQYPSSNAFDLYHPLHFQSNDITNSDGGLSPLSQSLPFLSLSLSEPSQADFSTPEVASSFGLGLSPYQHPQTSPDHNFFYYPYATHHELEAPSSPSRRRSMDLPDFDDHADGAVATVDLDFNRSCYDSQLPASDQPTSPPARTTWLSLPGADTDDSLVSPELALKGYNPDPAATVSSTCPAGLMLWDTETETERHSSGPSRGEIRPPSPEDFTIDPTVVARIGGDEGEMVYRLRERTARKEKWEREKYGELSTLLRLKLEALGASSGLSSSEDNSSPGNASIKELTMPGTCVSSSLISNPTPRASTVPVASLPSYTAHKLRPRITSMAQLVANMVFHRQQQPEIAGRGRRVPRRAHSQYIESSTNAKSPPPAKTPLSPLRHMVLPEPEDDTIESGSNIVLENVMECESPQPLSPLALSMMPLPLTFETKQ